MSDHEHKHPNNHGPDQVCAHEHSEKQSYPWKEGNYHGEGFFSNIVITGDKAVPTEVPDFTITFNQGDFGEADPEVAEMSGETNYTVEMKFEIMGKERKTPMVVTEEGKKLFFKSSIKTVPVGYLKWITQEEADLKAKSGDPISAPPSHYKLEPERQGKLVWITGAPGLGKSTTAQMLSRHHGFVFYEGDCFFGLRNPYIPSDVPEASMAQLKQRKLVGEGAKDRQELANKVNKEFMKMFSGEDCDDAVIEEGCKEMCSNIRQERARMGGDWAVCCVLLTRKIRDIVRAELGPELQIVCLEMELEDQMVRVRSRHAGDENSVDMMKAVYDLCERAGEDEPYTSEVKVIPGKTPEDIVEMVLEKIQ